MHKCSVTTQWPDAGVMRASGKSLDTSVYLPVAHHDSLVILAAVLVRRTGSILRTLRSGWTWRLMTRPGRFSLTRQLLVCATVSSHGVALPITAILESMERFGHRNGH